jgi:hypothetical protein
MSWGAVSDDHSTGEARLAPEATKATFLSEATAAGYLLVELAAPRPAARGRLGLVIDGAIERALEARGAPPPTAVASGDRELALGDQIHRARISGAAGLALWVSPLDAIATGGTLDCDDSATLRWWLLAATDRPVRLAFDATNRRLGVYMAPRTLESILAEAALAEQPVDSEASESAEGSFTDGPDDVGTIAAMASVTLETTRLAPDAGDASDEAPSDSFHGDADDEVDDARDREDVDHDDEELDDAPDSEPEVGLAESARAMAAQIDEDGDNAWLHDALMELSTPPPRPAELRVAESEHHVEAREPARRVVPTERVARPREQLAGDVPSDAARARDYEERLPPPPVLPKLELHFAEPHVAPERPRTELDEATRRKLEACARELEAASGPKPLAVVERLFTSAYVPLRAALDRGAPLPAARDTADEWARSFEKSYLDGFDALRVRTKRPAMTVDVPDIALRVARLHGARSTQLLLVDAMRYDLGDAVNARLQALVGQRAACAERFLLWAALPTTTGAQVELIGRGPAGLKEAPDGVSEDMIVARGRKASMIRRLKTGHREVLKLDVVAARITEPGGAEPHGFDAIADEVAARIAAHFEGLQPRTLVMVFGDHGFAVSDRGEGPAGVREGGASPEEVLVPAFAWLVGAVH